MAATIAPTRMRSYAAPRERLFSKPVWTGLVIVVVALALLPLLNVFVPVDSALHVSSYVVALLGKFMCYAIAALALLIWCGDTPASCLLATACSLRLAATRMACI